MYFAFSFCPWGSHGKNTGMSFPFLLQWTTFCQNSSLWPVCMAWLIASLSYTSHFAMTRLWSMKGIVDLQCVDFRCRTKYSVSFFFSDYTPLYVITRSVQFSPSVVSHFLWPHGLQHARLPCSSPVPGTCSNSCPSSQWCHPTISSSVVPLPSCPQSFPASGSFQMSQLFTSGGQSIGVSASASMNTQDRSSLGWAGWISLQSKGLSRVFSNTTVQKHQFFSAQLSSQSNCHIRTWPLEKP